MDTMNAAATCSFGPLVLENLCSWPFTAGKMKQVNTRGFSSQCSEAPQLWRRQERASLVWVKSNQDRDRSPFRILVILISMSYFNCFEL